MTTRQMTDAVREVTREDREAAWPFRAKCYGHLDRNGWLNGKYDHTPPIQAFAAHRLDALETRMDNTNEVSAGANLTDAQLKNAVTELLSNRGERPYRILQGGSALWETWLPSFRAAIRYLPAARNSCAGMDDVTGLRDFADQMMEAAAACCTDPDAGPDDQTSISFTGAEGVRIANDLHRLIDSRTIGAGLRDALIGPGEELETLGRFGWLDALIVDLVGCPAAMDALASADPVTTHEAIQECQALIRDVRAALSAGPAPAVNDAGDAGEGNRCTASYMRYQADAAKLQRWMQDKAWQDAVLMLVHYQTIAQRTWLVGHEAAAAKLAEWWRHARALSETKSIEDIAAIPKPAVDGLKAENDAYLSDQVV